jgi:hypothetical protein
MAINVIYRYRIAHLQRDMAQGEAEIRLQLVDEFINFDPKGNF